MQKKISIVWFKKDLRLSDNPALLEACRLGEILPIYIFDDSAPDLFKIGGASKIWLNSSLDKLNKSLKGKLNVYVGKSSKIIANLIKQYNIDNLFYNKCYEIWSKEQQNDVEIICQKLSVNCKSFDSNCLWLPNEILKDDLTYYKVFTAYKKKSYKIPPRKTVKNTREINAILDFNNKSSIIIFFTV